MAPIVRYGRQIWRGQNLAFNSDLTECLDPNQYREEVVNGFVDAYRFLSENKRLVLGTVYGYDDLLRKVSPPRSRIILRTTLSYASEVMGVLLPREGAEIRDNVMSSLLEQPVIVSPNHISDVILEAETKDILSANIPYFWTEFGEQSLVHQSGIVDQNYFDSDHLNRIQVAIDQLGSQDLGHQTDVLNHSLSQAAR